MLHNLIHILRLRIEKQEVDIFIIYSFLELASSLLWSDWKTSSSLPLDSVLFVYFCSRICSLPLPRLACYRMWVHLFLDLVLQYSYSLCESWFDSKQIVRITFNLSIFYLIIQRSNSYIRSLLCCRLNSPASPAMFRKWWQCCKLSFCFAYSHLFAQSILPYNFFCKFQHREYVILIEVPITNSYRHFIAFIILSATTINISITDS